MKRFLPWAAFFVFFLAMANSVEADPHAPLIPDDIYNRITIGTLGENAAPGDRDKRDAEVRDWVSSIGGDNWYRNYLANFAPPSNPLELYVAEHDGLSAKKLGYFYVHQPLTSADSATWFTCQPSGLSQTATIIELCALSDWNAYILTGLAPYADATQMWANYIIRNSVNGQLQWHKDVPARNLKAPWISGLSQSLAVSVLLRAYEYSGNAVYLDAAKQAYHWLTVPLAQGGLQSSLPSGAWLEEYPDKKNPSHVLNGNMWALFGVWDYYRVTRDPAALALFKSDIAAIKTEIPAWYDVGYWSAYDHLKPASMVTGMYQQFIIQQLYALYGITGDPFFKVTADKWSAYQATDALFIHMGVVQFLAANPALATAR
jgi:hypothetical protein